MIRLQLIKSLFFIGLLMPLCLFAQQTYIRGVVTLQNSETETGKRIYIDNARVTDDFDRAQPTITDKSGRFQLIYIGIPEGVPVSFSVQKVNSNLEVVNISVLSAITGQKDELRITMAAKDKIADYRKKLYDVGKTAAEKKLNQIISEKKTELQTLKKEHFKNIDRIKELEDDLFETQIQKSKIEKNASELAQKYASINLDDVSPIFRSAFELFQNGNLDSALLTLNAINYRHALNTFHNEEDKINKINREIKNRSKNLQAKKQQISEALLLRADLYTTSYRFDSAIKCYDLLSQIDPKNPKNLLEYGRFLAWLNKHEEAIIKYKEAIRMTNSFIPDSQAKAFWLTPLYHNLGESYRALKKYSQSEECYNESMRLCLLNPSKYIIQQYLSTAQIGLGGLKIAMNDFGEAERYFLSSISILDTLTKNYPALYDLDLRVAKINLALVYINTNNFNKAEKISLSILQEASKNTTINPEITEFDLSLVQSNLAHMYFKMKDFTKSNQFFEACVPTQERLARLNPDAYGYYLAATMNNLGLLYNELNDLDKSEQAFKKSLEIRNGSEINNALVNQPEVAGILNSLAAVCVKKGNLTEAKSHFQKSIEIRTNLAKDAPSVYNADLAKTLNSIAWVNYLEDDFEMAIDHYRQAIKLFKTFALSDTSIYTQYVASTICNLGLVYASKKNFVKSEEILQQAYEIQEKIVRFNPAAYEPDFAATCTNLGFVYMEMKLFDKAEKYFTQSFTIKAKLYNQDPNNFLESLIKVSKNLIEVFRHQLDSAKTNPFKERRVDGFTKLEPQLEDIAMLNTEVASRLSWYYSRRAWYLLVAARFEEASYSASKGTHFDYFILENKCYLAHALFFQNKDEEALEIYNSLKNSCVIIDRSICSELIAQLEILEGININHKKTDKIKNLFRK